MTLNTLRNGWFHNICNLTAVHAAIIKCCLILIQKPFHFILINISSSLQIKINTLSVAYTISFYGPRMLHYKFENFWNFHLGKIKTISAQRSSSKCKN